jgi:hypothetical protein
MNTCAAADSFNPEPAARPATLGPHIIDSAWSRQNAMPGAPPRSKGSPPCYRKLGRRRRRLRVKRLWSALGLLPRMLLKKFPDQVVGRDVQG